MSLRAVVFSLSLLAAGPAIAAGVGGPPTPSAEEREPGIVLAAHGDTYIVQVGSEPAVGAGTVLQVYRRLPSRRGVARYREATLWWEVGRLAVASVADGMAIATQVSGPPIPMPAGLDESGAPAERVQIGDAVRTTGAVGDRRPRSRVVFPVGELFSPEDTKPTDEGRSSIAHWVRGVKRIEGPVEVRVRTRLRELGSVGPDLSRSVSASNDAGEGPVPGDAVTPIVDLYAEAASPSEAPPAHVVHVVEPGETVETYQYLDPVTLAHRRGESIADLVAAATGLERDAILVTVVPLPVLTAHEDAPGYDQAGDAVWILAGDLEWAEPEEEKPPVTPESKPAVPTPDLDKPRLHFERLPPGEVS